jgi:NAD(P)H dehydrogenase (quinone)
MNDKPDAGQPKHAVILCHPEERSFNRAVADAYCDAVQELGHEFVLRDLYRIGFDPVLKATERSSEPGFVPHPDVEQELALLSGCDVFTLVYPIWFGTPPAMMKGYVERVLGSGVNPQSVKARAGTPLLGGKRLLSFTTSAMSDPWLNEQGQWMSLRYIFDHYLAHAFGMLGDNHVHFGNVRPGMEARWAEQHLYEVKQQARQSCATALDDRRKRTGDAVPTATR